MSLSIPKVLTSQVNDGSSIGRKSDFNSARQPCQTSESKKPVFAINGMFIQNREDKIRHGEQDKSIWNYLKSKLKLKRKEKSNFISYVESNGMQNFDQYQTVNNHLFHIKQRQSYANFVDSNYLRVPKSIPKENKFQAGTLDSRRINPKDLPGQTLWRPRRQEKLLSPEKTYRSRILYLGEGTVERIDRWLAESEHFMRTGDYSSPIATVVVGSNRTLSQQVVQTPTSSRNHDKKVVKSPQLTEVKLAFVDFQKQKSTYEASEWPTVSKNLFQQSSRSINNLPILRETVDNSQNTSKIRPYSYFDGNEMVYDQGTNQAWNSELLQDTQIFNEFIENQNLVQPIPSSEMANECAIKSQNSVKDDICLQRNNNAHYKLNGSDRSKSAESVQTFRELINQPLFETSSLPCSVVSSISLDGLSFDGSYCTDYTPYAFGEQFILLNDPSNRGPSNEETSILQKSEGKIECYGLQNAECSKIKIPAEDNIHCPFKDNQSLYANPQAVKFVTTIYLTNDESNPDDFPTIDKEHTYSQPEKWNNKIKHRISSLCNNFVVEDTTDCFEQPFALNPNVRNRLTEKICEIELPNVDPRNETQPNVVHSDVNRGSEIGSISLPAAQISEHLEFRKNRNLAADCNRLDVETTKRSINFQRNQFKQENYCIPTGKDSDSMVIDSSKFGKPSSEQYTKLESLVEKNVFEVRGDEIPEIRLFESTIQQKRLQPSDERSVLDNSNTTNYCSSKTPTDHNLSIDCKGQEKQNCLGQECDDMLVESSSCVSRNDSKVSTTTYSKTERHSPPLNNFTSKSNFSLFEELVCLPSDPLLRLKNASPARSSQIEFSVKKKSAEVAEAQLQYPESDIRYQKYGILESGHGIDAIKSLEKPPFDALAFMSVNQNDHAKIFDLCFGNSSVFSKMIPTERTHERKIIETPCHKDKRLLHDPTQRQLDKAVHTANSRSFSHAFYV